MRLFLHALLSQLRSKKSMHKKWKDGQSTKGEYTCIAYNCRGNVRKVAMLGRLKHRMN